MPFGEFTLLQELVREVHEIVREARVCVAVRPDTASGMVFKMLETEAT